MDTTKKPLYKSLYFQVVVAIVIGILLGHFYPDTGAAMRTSDSTATTRPETGWRISMSLAKAV